jgi:nicotinate-nucleotide pyrophosphorylase (carboxylating)
MDVREFIDNAIKEDVGPGDYSSLSCIHADAIAGAKLMVKEPGVLAGIEIAKEVFATFDPEISFVQRLKDGDEIEVGDIAFTVEGRAQKILSAERLVLNLMQRMSGIATLTRNFVKELEGTNAKLLDTRKTTPNFRYFEKLAVKIGGGHNHRFGLYDMMMLKDNHVDYAGGIEAAITRALDYQQQHQLNLQIEIETRNLAEVEEVLRVGKVNRIMLDNFDVYTMAQAVELINGAFETEASGNIKLKNIRQYAQTGVDYISVGAITHSYKSLDLSLKAIS